ncbi:hypothetical protein GLOIN_2v1785920 [Rhizophagus clarus]|uniref:Uncharacterized protein n=1 Tax=Rhizophagus clarus TaxID=94130 RepID=A0A8H3L392_9GLOM|nr:hypothetical protein GLOIN_2v1785920 [Rhizophagus clarus]
MPRKTKRQLQINEIPKKKGRYISKDQEETEIEAEKEDLKEFEKVGKRLITEVLYWHENATHGIRAAYNGTSRITVWRKNKKKEELTHNAKEMQTLDTLFRSNEASTKAIKNLEIRLKEISQQCLLTKSVKTNKNIFTYDYLRHLSICRYIQLLLNGQGELLIYCQEKHTKLESLLDDEDFKEECLTWLRQQKPESCTPENLKIYIEGMVFLKLTGHIKKDIILEKTCQNYMHLWGYKYDERKKGVYYDGHERPDVIKYRKEWLERMFGYQKFMKNFDGEMMDIVSEPYLKQEEKELVQLVHQAILIFEILHSGCVAIFCFDQSTNHNAMVADALIATRMNLSSGDAQPKMRDSWYINEDGNKIMQSMVFPDNHKLKGKLKGIK